MQALISPQKTKIGGKSNQLFDELKQLQSTILIEDESILSKQTEKLKEVKKYLEDVKERTANHIKEAALILQKLQDEAQGLEKKIEEDEKMHADGAKEMKIKTQISKLHADYITSCKQRVTIASQINPKLLRNIQLQDKKSPANEIFKWILNALYLTPQTKYYWPNFQQEAFQKDNGKDLIERLGKFSALQAKEEQKTKTDLVLTLQSQILESPELTNVRKEIENIFAIVRIYSKSIDIGKQIKVLEKQIEDDKVIVGKLKEENVRLKARADAIRDRYNVIKKYLQQLQIIHEAVSPKPDVYAKKIEDAEEFKKMQKTSGAQTLYTPNVDLKEEREDCTCHIY